jgi:hypothetical protein
MLNRYVTLGLGLLVSIAVANAASAADDSDTRYPKPCGGYYACIEFQPAQPGPDLRLGSSPAPSQGARCHERASRPFPTAANDAIGLSRNNRLSALAAYLATWV